MNSPTKQLQQYRTQKPQQKLSHFTSIYMQQNSPNNPFGPNYKQLPLNTKIQYKFSLVKQFIKLSPQDQLHKEIQEQKFLGTLILGFVGGYFVAEIPRMIYSKLKNINARRGWPVVLSICSFSSYGYVKAHQRYFQQVPNKFLDKYLPEAIENGFQDYQISKAQ